MLPCVLEVSSLAALYVYVAGVAPIPSVEEVRLPAQSYWYLKSLIWVERVLDQQQAQAHLHGSRMPSMHQP